MDQLLPSSIFTENLVTRGIDLDFDALPSDVVAIAQLCLLDWLGVAVAGAGEDLVDILVADACDDGTGGRSTIVGRPERAGTLQAILINGAAGHALDYDDSNPATMGHPSVCLAPVVLGLGEAIGANGREMLVAFVAGYEAMARVAGLMTSSHYRRGFHGTATMGTFGATIAAARLLGLDAARTRHALGIAGTRASGVRASFGTMCKPLHAGNAAFTGASSARLAARGFTGAADIFADPRGFPATHGAGFDERTALSDPPGGFHILGNLFKWHAACHLTHGAIDAVSALRDAHGLTPDTVRRVVLRVPPFVEGVCDIATPVSGLETKFSLRMVAAFALAGVDTADPASFSDAHASDPSLGRLRDTVEIEVDPAMGSGAHVMIEAVDGSSFERGEDPTRVDVTPAERERAVRHKFMALAVPMIGAEAAAGLADAVGGFDRHADVGAILAMSVPSLSQRQEEKAA